MALVAERQAPADRTGDRLSVLIINDFADVTGGTARVALAEAAGLARRGHRVTLVAGHGEPDPEVLGAGVTVHTTNQPTTWGDSQRVRAAARGIWNPVSARLVGELASSTERPAVVHVHGFTKVVSASVVRAAVRSGLPVLATLHDYFAACPNGAFYIYPRGEACMLRPLSARCIATDCDARAYSHKVWRVGRSAVQRSLGAMPGRVGDLIAPSRHAAEILRPYLPSTARVHILANPVQVPHMPPAEESIDPTYVFVGRLQREKGPLLLARAARAARVPATFVGEGDEAAAIRSTYPEAKLTGWLTPAAVQAAIRGARAVVTPSLGYEVQPLVPLEAAAQGVPSIVSDRLGERDAIDDGVSGLWFRAGDVDDLAEKLSNLWHDADLARQLGRAAYERFWSEPRDLATHLDELERIYRGALA